MKQILQSLKNGTTDLYQVPSPIVTYQTLLIQSSMSLVSSGTERMLVDFGRSSYLNKARQQPDKVKEVLNKIKTDGVLTTYEAVKSKLDQPIPLGYCNVGRVIESGIASFQVGERVVSNGNHAEVVRVPKNLCARIPDNVDDESASFTVLASIGLQGVRLAQPTMGECFSVFGLGLIGLLTVQLLRANGCRVLGIDFNSKRCELAKQFGAEVVDLSQSQDPVIIAQQFSRSRGIDGVIITAATKSDELMHQAATMCRKRARIILVGVVGLNLRRDDFFKKEITFQVSASYGPGRYDPEYEEKGNDYPVGFVRWTEQRNFEAILDMMSAGALDVKPLITHRFDIEAGEQAYEKLDDASALGIILKYPEQDSAFLRNSQVILTKPSTNPSGRGNTESPVVSVIGAGNYASRVLIPAFKKANVTLRSLVSSGGVSSVHHGKKHGFEVASTDWKKTLQDENTNTVVIATQHDQHASQVIKALRQGKHVFVEKPLALTHSELNEIELAYQEANEAREKPVLLMVGFNRRFAPHVVKMKSLLDSVQEPKSVIITVNAGMIPADHWTQDPEVGGGRIIGEGCHFIDLLCHLIGHEVTDFSAMSFSKQPGLEVSEDKATMSFKFSDGSMGTIHYLANGGKAFQKERIEIFAGNGVLQLNNYRRLKGYGWRGFSKLHSWWQDKGQTTCVQAFVDAISKGNNAPIQFEELMASSRLTIDVDQRLREC